MVEDRFLFFTTKFESIIDYTEYPMRGMDLRQVKGYFKEYHGSWRLIPREGGTLFTYQAFILPESSIPMFLIEHFMNNRVQQRFEAVKRSDFTKRGYKPEEIEAKAKEAAERLSKGFYVPHVIEPSAGADRLILALVCNAYREEMIPDAKGNPELRVVMKFHPRVAPVKVGVFPLLKNRPELIAKAREVFELLRPHMTVTFDDAGSIGKRYARQDEAGTPFGVTIDFDTLGEKPELLDTVTLRDRDTTQQTRVKIGELLPLLLEKLR